ncbi:hypothetical protein S96127_3653 [Yersinia pestis]|nr:hypothetical protein S96127_3653 [Yersinia pestis]
MFVRIFVCGYKCGYKLLVLKINNIDISRLYDISESGLRTISMKIKSPQGGFFLPKIQSQQGLTSLISQHKSI